MKKTAGVKSTGGLLRYEGSIKNIHAEKCQQSVSAIIFHSTFVCGFLHKDAVGGHTGISVLRKLAGLSQCALAGTAQSAAACAYQKSVAAFSPETLSQPDLAGIMRCFCRLYSSHVGIIRDLPNGLQNHCIFVGQDSLPHLLRGAAVRRAGVIGTILAAEIFFTVGSERGIKYDIPGIENFRIGKTFFQSI